MNAPKGIPLTNAANVTRGIRLRTPLVLIAHQFMGTYGTAFLAAFAGTSVYELLRMFNRHASMRFVHWILTGTPYYPVQIALAVYIGWKNGKHLPHRLMVWVWVLPFLVLGYAFATATVLVPEWSSVLTQPGVGQSRLSYYFGWGCLTTAHCLDLVVVTMPFYVSVAYSIGAGLANRTKQMREASSSF